MVGPVPVGRLVAVVLVDPDVRIVVRLVEPLAVQVLVRLDKEAAERAIAIEAVLVPGRRFGTVGRPAAVDRDRGVAVRQLVEIERAARGHIAPARFSTRIGGLGLLIAVRRVIELELDALRPLDASRLVVRELEGLVVEVLRAGVLPDRHPAVFGRHVEDVAVEILTVELVDIQRVGVVVLIPGRGWHAVLVGVPTEDAPDLVAIWRLLVNSERSDWHIRPGGSPRAVGGLPADVAACLDLEVDVGLRRRALRHTGNRTHCSASRTPARSSTCRSRRSRRCTGCRRRSSRGTALRPPEISKPSK